MKKTLLSVFIFLSTFTCYAQISNINVSNTTVFGGEPYMAINPTNPNNIVIAWIAADLTTGLKATIKTKVSFDGGATWGSPFNQPHMSPTWGSADPSMAFRKNGTVYLSYIDYRKTPDSGGVYITHSINGGVNWSVPTRAWNANTEDPTKIPLDRPWLAVDNSTTTTQGMFYMTTKPAPWITVPNRSYFKSSSDSGAIWSNYRYTDTTGYLIGSAIAAPMAALCVAADGAVCMAYPSYVPSQSVFPKIFFAKSYNKGGTFSRYDLIVNPTSVPGPNHYKLGYNLAANPNNASQLAACYVGHQAGDPDVYVTTTNNGGINWNAPVRVNDDALSNGKAQDLVWATYSKNNKLLVVWRDKRNGTGTGFYQPSDIYCSVSLNNGASFQSNIRLTNISAAHDTVLTQDGNDFLSCELVNDTIYATWGDVRTGKLNIYFAKTSIATGLGLEPILLNGEDAPSVLVYPNPTSDKLKISVKDEKIKSISISIINVEGKEVLKFEGKNNFDIDLKQLSAGTYFARVYEGDKLIRNSKIVVSR
ncbi:MAG: T9SS type A sorting domain-containing protein [Bacteroidia bacterium]|nr:T9SS type A sorting domain-containing protein [Bacteroidia bacterium]